MKRILFLLSVALLCILSINAYDFEVDGIYYRYQYKYENESVVSVTKGDVRYSGNVIIPDSVTYNGTTHRVGSIGDSAFAYSAVQSVTIPNSVERIFDKAFMWCFDLISVNIGQSVYRIGEGAFYRCIKLQSVTIPDKVHDLDDRAFSNCLALTSVTIGSAMFNFGVGAFAGCTNLTTVNFNAVQCKGLAKSDYLWFNECPLSTLNFGEGVKKIPSSIAYNQKGLTSVTLPNGVTSIENHAFAGSGLTSVSIPNSVTSVGDNAFSDCQSLSSAIIGDSLPVISAGCFSGCKSLSKVVIGRGVDEIGTEAFKGCRKLVTIYSLNQIPPEIADATVFDKSVYADIYAPKDYIFRYERGPYWKDFLGKYIGIDSEVGDINGDINGDGIVDMADVSALINQILK